MDWASLVEERRIWVDWNFPDERDRGDTSSILGVIEEQGELAHAHLKLTQKIRTNEDHIANAKDAVGDLTIYLMGVMHHRGVDLGKLEFSLRSGQAPTSQEKTLFKLAQAVGRLSGAANTTSTDRPQWENICADILKALMVYCNSRYWDYERIVLDTWREVSIRDWVTYPDTGLPTTA